MHAKRDSRGFTLIELLIVIGIIGFLAAAVLVAVDPVKRIQDSRDARRYSEVNAILNAILTKQVDDRSLYAGCCDTGPAAERITTQSGSLAQVIVTSDYGVNCTAQATRPGCAKALNTASAKSCIANLSTTFAGAGTASSSGTAVTGVGTSFVAEVEVGDTLTDADNAASTCTVSVVGSNSSITCSNTPTPAMSGDFLITSADDSSIVPSHLAAIPVDPRGTGNPCGTGSGCATLGDLNLGATNSGYYIARTSGNRIEIGSCAPEQSLTISVKR